MDGTPSNAGGRALGGERTAGHDCFTGKPKKADCWAGDVQYINSHSRDHPLETPDFATEQTSFSHLNNMDRVLRT